jgi:DNA-binding Xre family transcriptional regulator
MQKEKSLKRSSREFDIDRMIQDEKITMSELSERTGKSYASLASMAKRGVLKLDTIRLFERTLGISADKYILN